MVRKIPPEYENPIDDIIIHLANNTDSVYKYFNMSPNHLTTLSLFFGILTAYFIYKGYKELAVLAFFMSYYYDCMDGNYARKHNMVTDFGDRYDHFSDWFKSGLILFALYKRNPEKIGNVIVVLGIFSILSFIHLGCQEKMSHVHYDQSVLDNLKILCPNNNFIHISKWFGTGTLFLATIIAIYTY